jgi:hypothetical protein
MTPTLTPGMVGTGTTGFVPLGTGFTTPVVVTPGAWWGYGPAYGGIPNAGTRLGPPAAAPARLNTAAAGRTAAPTGAVHTSNARQTMARGAMDVATARRFNTAAGRGALQPASVARASTSGYVWVKVNQNRVASVRAVPSSDVFFYRGGELMDAATFPGMVQPGESVMVADPSRMPL